MDLQEDIHRAAEENLAALSRPRSPRSKRETWWDKLVASSVGLRESRSIAATPGGKVPGKQPSLDFMLTV